ncbi:MAG: radical SAM protein [Patescibacteria group bacterium]
MNEKSPFNTNKLIHHKSRVKQILQYNDSLKVNLMPFPITVEFDLVKSCNQGCRWCNFKSWSKRQEFFPIEQIDNLFVDLKKIGVKAIEIVGGGEPLLHPHINKIISKAHHYGFDLGLITNGTLLPKIFSNIDNFTFIRISLDAATAPTYVDTHYYYKKSVNKEKDFDRVLKNIDSLSKQISNNKIGVAFLITPWNYNEIEQTATKVKALGAGYIVYRPASGINIKKNDLQKYWRDVNKLLRKAKQYENQKFKVYSSAKSRWLFAQKKKQTNGYCLGSLVYAVVEADGNIPFCNLFRGRKKYSLGNIVNGNSFSKIWRSKKHQNMFKQIDVKYCPYLCKANDYTLQIKTSNENFDSPANYRHKNFL